MYVNENGETPGLQGLRRRRPLPGRPGRPRRAPTAEGGRALAEAIERRPVEVSAAIADGANLIVLSDRNSTAEHGPHPLAAADGGRPPPPGPGEDPDPGRPGRRDRRRPRGPPHGPADRLRGGRRQPVPGPRDHRRHDRRRASSKASRPARPTSNYIKAACKGVLKVMSKMGISTVASYTGAQVFEAVGPRRATWSTSTSPARPAASAGSASTCWRPRWPPATAWPTSSGRPSGPTGSSRSGGEYQWRREGEHHLFNPKTVFKLQHATRAKRYEIFKEYTRAVDDQSEQAGHPPGPAPAAAGRPARPDRRGRAGRVDHGPLLDRRHVLRLHLGRGPRDPGHRHEPHRRPVQHRRGRRGPRALRARRQRRPAAQRRQAGGLGPLRGDGEYLVNADDLQIKISQGAKPGEGGQLPGHKVYPWIARTRYSTPGRRADLAAAAPRHLLDRGHRPAHPRPEVGQPPGPGPREAGGRGRGGHGGRRRGQGPLRRGAHLGPRRRHRGGPAHLAQARRHPLGAGPGRDPADAA